MAVTTSSCATPVAALQLYVVDESRQPQKRVNATQNDTADGSAARPFTSLTAARDFLRSLRPLPAAGAVVNVGCGLHGPLELNASDSGTEGSPILYQGAFDKLSGEPCALISAGLRVPASAFRPWAPRPGVVVANLSALGMTAFGKITNGDLEDCQNHKAELFFGGKPMQLARWPNNLPNSSSGQTCKCKRPMHAITLAAYAVYNGQCMYWIQLMQYASGSHAENGTGEAGLILDPATPALRHRWADAEDGWIHAYLHFSEPNTSDRCAEPSFC